MRQVKTTRFDLSELTAAELKRCRDRLNNNTEKSGDCLEWRGWKNRVGYGSISVKCKPWATHRLAWVLEKGPIPPDKLVCHTCDNRACCNVSHMFLGSHKDNMADCRKKNRYYYSNLTHCKHGHEFTPENTYYRVGTTLRSCKMCQRIRMRIEAGWTKEQAETLSVTPRGYRPINGGLKRRADQTTAP